MVESYIGLYLTFGITTLILQIILLCCIGNNPYVRCGRWNRLLGISIASVVSDMAFTCVISTNIVDILGDGFLAFLCILPFFITHIILLIIGVIKKSKYKEENIRINIHFIITMGIIVALAGILIATPDIIRRNTVISYLKNLYGDGEYEIVSMYNNSRYNDAIHKYYDGYTAKVKAYNTNKVYKVDVLKNGIINIDENNTVTFEEYEENIRKVDETSKNNIKVNNIEQHYIDVLKNVIEKKYNIDDVRINLNNEKVPNTSESPTFDELVKTGALEYIHISNKNYNYSKEESEKYIRELTADLVTYMIKDLKVSQDIKLTILVDLSESGTYKKLADYWIEIENNALKIIDMTKSTEKRVIEQISLDSYRY